MKTEAQVFFEETKPFIEHLSEVVNPQHCLNMVWGYPHLEKLMNERDFNMEIAEPGTKGPAISIGSGPSLDACMPFLNEAREKHEAPIFCTSSQVWTLYHQGVTPDYVTQHDPWPRQCPICGPLDKMHVYFDDAGECFCYKGHHITGDEKETLIRNTNIHRWAPEIGCKVLFQPGVAKEQMMWPDLINRGEMYYNNFNPSMGDYTTRDIFRGQRFGMAGEAFRKVQMQAVQKVMNDAWLRGQMNDMDPQAAKQIMAEFNDTLRPAWDQMIIGMLNAPGTHEPQDTPMWLSVILFGDPNQKIKYPVRTAAAFTPSATFQNAVLAYMKGYSPIYFIGYDLCHWKHRGYHHKFMYDGTDIPVAEPTPPTEDSRVANNGFKTDYVQIGEKYALAGYLSKVFRGYYGLPGMRVVEVIAEGTPGNLEFYPKIDIEDFAKGGTRDVSQEKTAKKIMAIIKERKMDVDWKVGETGVSL